MNIREKLGLKPKATPQFGQSRSHAMNASKRCLNLTYKIRQLSLMVKNIR